MEICCLYKSTYWRIQALAIILGHWTLELVDLNDERHLDRLISLPCTIKSFLILQRPKLNTQYIDQHDRLYPKRPFGRDSVRFFLRKSFWIETLANDGMLKHLHLVLLCDFELEVMQVNEMWLNRCLYNLIYD